MMRYMLTRAADWTWNAHGSAAVGSIPGVARTSERKRTAHTARNHRERRRPLRRSPLVEKLSPQHRPRRTGWVTRRWTTFRPIWAACRYRRSVSAFACSTCTSTRTASVGHRLTDSCWWPSTSRCSQRSSGSNVSTPSSWRSSHGTAGDRRWSVHHHLNISFSTIIILSSRSRSNKRPFFICTWSHCIPMSRHLRTVQSYNFFSAEQFCMQNPANGIEDGRNHLRF